MVGYWALGLELVALLKFHATMHVFLSIFRVADLLINSEHLLLEDFTTGFVYGRKVFKVNNKQKLSSNLLVNGAFALRV